VPPLVAAPLVATPLVATPLGASPAGSARCWRSTGTTVRGPVRARHRPFTVLDRDGGHVVARGRRGYVPSTAVGARHRDNPGASTTARSAGTHRSSRTLSGSVIGWPLGLRARVE